MSIENENSEWEIASTWKLISYSFGSLIVFSLGGAYTATVFYFYEVEVGLPVVLLGLAFIVFAVWNMVNDPLLGYLTDKPRNWTKKWGMRFPWIMIGIFPTLIFYLLLFTVPENLIEKEDIWLIFLYFIIISCLYDTFYSLFWTHIYAGVANHFRTEFERRRFAALSMLVSLILALPLSFIGPIFIIYGDRSSYILAALILIIYYCFFVVLLIPSIRESKELKEMFIQGYESAEEKPFWKTMKIALRHKNFTISLVTLTLIQIAITLYQASGIYFMKDILRLPLIYSILLGLAYFAASIIAIPFWINFARKHGFAKTYSLGLLLGGLAYLPLLWITTIEGAIIFAFIFGLLSAGYWFMIVPIATDCYDEIAIKMEKRQDATLVGIRTFFYRIAFIIQGIIIAAVHVATSYNPDPHTIQSPLAIWGIRVHMGLIPMICMLFASFIMFKWYDLKGEKKQAMVSKLRKMGL